jgi:hypothetical protein
VVSGAAASVVGWEEALEVVLEEEFVEASEGKLEEEKLEEVC